MITSAHNTLNLRNLVLASVAAVFFASTAVHAGDGPSGSEPTKKTVTYGDLNLANPHGIERLYQRIASAAHDVCNAKDDSLKGKIEFSTCSRESIARAVRAVNDPALTALHAEKTGQAPVSRLARQ
jgi:UrcA family protein